MKENKIQYITDEDGNTTGVIVPIDLWEAIISDEETSHLLDSEKMKKRLFQARERNTGFSIDEVRQKLGI